MYRTLRGSARARFVASEVTPPYPLMIVISSMSGSARTALRPQLTLSTQSFPCSRRHYAQCPTWRGEAPKFGRLRAIPRSVLVRNLERANMKTSMVVAAAMSVLALGACERATTFVPAAPAVVVNVPVPGPAGPQGPPGTTAEKGETGATGMTGSPGMTGPTGMAGSTGMTGSTGMMGAEGVKGEQGKTGDAKVVVVPAADPQR